MVGNNSGQQATTSSSDRYSPAPKFTTDERTNTLIVSATVSDLNMVEALVKKLDQDPTEAMAVLVTPLRNANAENLAQILTDSLADSPGQSAGGGGRNNQGRNNQGRNNQGRNNQGRNNQQSSSGSNSVGGLVGDVTVVADTEANALVFTTSQRNFDRIRAVVGELDRPRRQVFIECLIAEVRLTDKGELGVQWDALFTNDILNEKDGTQSVGTDFGLGSLNDGMRYTTDSGKLTGFLRALQTDGRLNILSSPKILCLENQDAEISVGQEVPFVTNSRITQNGDTVNTIQYRDVGIILQVTPQVNEDGHVRMVIHPEVSSIAPASESVLISEGVRSPTFNRNFADTTIVVGDSETAVIGGLISNSVVETEFKIPFLGSIPILGRLFGSTIKEKVKQEIVVFLTPHVVESVGGLRARTTKTLSEFAMVPVEVVREELDRWLRGLDHETHPYHYNRGTVLLEGGRVPEAIDDLRKAIRFKGSDPAAHFNLGLALARSGRLEEAKTELKIAGVLAPGDVEIPYNLAAVYWRQENYPMAAAKFQRALELDPLHEQAREWLPRALRELRRLESELLKEKSE
jgi:general secretion pathway protein D